MQHQVQLPNDQLIEYWRFCKAIAQAICPADEQSLEGIDCIVGKRRTCQVAIPAPVCGEEKLPITVGWQSVLQSDDGHTLDQLCMDPPDATESSQPLLPLGGTLNHQVFELQLPYKLTEDDLREMESLLTDLPELQYPVSEEVAAAFMSAYIQLPKRPAWEPILITVGTIEQRKAKQDMVMRDHQKALQEELTHGRLVAVDANHVRVTRLAVGTFIPREQAIAYLERCGIPHSNKEMGDSNDSKTEVPADSREPRDGKRNAVGERQLSHKQRREAVALYHELKKQRRDYCKQVAQRYSISTRRVRYLVKEVEAEQNKGRIDVWLHKKPQ